MSVRLSHSSKETFNQCGLKWKLHYINKYRSRRTSSALLFGVSCDEALNTLLLTGNYAECEMVFTELWLQHQHSTLIDFYPSDTDASLLTLPTIMAIEAITDDSKRAHALAWNTLLVKGVTMLRAYHTDIYPRIKKVISVQEKISLVGVCENGDETTSSITGIIDAIVEMELDDGTIETVILDNKTSSVPYPKNAISTKEQTALYSIAKPEYSHVGFAILVKKQLGRTQLLIGKPPEELKQKTLDNFVQVLEDIEAGKFQQNRKSCKAYGSFCQFYSYCHGEGFSDDIYEKID
ncbi:MAG: PD-(D/E)XK nuclease family protein [Bacteroidales bacterium]